MNHPEIPDVAALHRGGSPQFWGAANLGLRESGNTRTSGAALMDNVENYYVTLHIYIYVYISTCMYIIVYYCISADPSHLQGERARGKVALSIRSKVRQ